MTQNERSARSVAVIDDDASLRRLLRQTLERAGYKVLEGGDGEEAERIAREEKPDAMILDVRMPKKTGLEALETIKAERPETVVTLLTAYMDLRDAVGAIKTGAHDYLEKPVDLDELVVVVDESLGISRENGLPSTKDEVALPPGIVAESEAMLAVFRDAQRVAPTDASVLILGESGTGKEVLADFLHKHSDRRAHQRVSINCSALPENLIESELFGHERGAFTGATSRKMGLFQEANGGTLFLDEIGEMPLALQPKLLRALEEKRIRPVGGSRDVEVDVRVVAATNRSLIEDAREGRFREDLLYRLNVFALNLPPLRERRQDILPLAKSFLAQEIAKSGGKARGKRFSPALERVLLSHSWPGNVRELYNAVVRAFIISRGLLILPDDLPETVHSPTSQGVTAPGSGGVLIGNMEEIQKQAILEALEKSDGNKTKAAELLGISRRNLIYKLRSYGM